MGRKRRGGPEALPRLLLPLLAVLLGGASGDGEVGCLFSKNLCKPNIETCFNDLAFGRCILIDEFSETDLYQYNLEPEELELLRMQLERLEVEGYKWPHFYTQCVMRILLDDLRYRLSNDVERLCRHLKDDEIFDEENGVVVKDNVDPERVAIVKFMPSELNPHGEFADEFYYPPDMRQRIAEERMKAEAADYKDYDEGFFDKLASIDRPDDVVYRRGSRSLSKKSQDPSAPLTYPSEGYGAVPREYLQALRDFLERESGPYDTEDGLEFLTDRERTPSMDDYAKTFARKYKLPREPDDYVDRSLDELEVGPYEEAGDDDDDDDDDASVEREVELEPDGWKREQQPVGKAAIDAALESGMYTEGGAILPLRRDAIRPEEYDDLPMDLDSILWRREMSGFKRRERLDVKKPGPLFSTNNYAFKTQPPPTPDDDNSNEGVQDVQDVEDNDVMYLPQTKKEVPNSKIPNSPKSYANVDLDHVYIEFNQEFNTWFEGERVVNLVGQLIGLEPKELKEIRVDLKEVTFKVPKNSKNYNATDVVLKLGEKLTELQKQLNIEVIRAGIGDKTKLPPMLEVTRSTEISSRMFGALVAAGVAAVTAAAIVILVIARRHAKSRAKLAGLRTPDPEASKDYQELCRARMQAKQPDKLSESPKGFDFGRLIESGRSESNRSSTSSWSEEPQVSNMDVATGHVVLSYMEEHLKNQEKLDEEWATVCAYEAEPCSTAIAEAEGNAECNRPGAALPYDHSRVILNDLANLNNSDYINASTITDHDPRNPAYIATQGPLPQTAADFWQLVWEQGSVVIVMLTRLTEEGQAMCHRYWPDEGSELYHIYEVHLVSEHIWCDDYLVRSFYLKNLRTGETRTVTQFHFLSWPHNQIPKSTKALLEFRRKVNKSYRGRSCPIIVHCSDGASRTGTYCLIDMVLNRMSKGAKEIDIAATLEHIRDQRAGMVATKQQYEFVLMAVAEEVHAILKSLPAVAEKPAAPPAEKQETAPATKSDK